MFKKDILMSTENMIMEFEYQDFKKFKNLTFLMADKQYLEENDSIRRLILKTAAVSAWKKLDKGEKSSVCNTFLRWYRRFYPKEERQIRTLNLINKRLDEIRHFSLDN